MQASRLTRTDLFFALALILAAAIRLIGLDVPSLSDSEATWALQAMNAVQSGHAMLGAQPGYILLTGASFYILGAGDYLARFWPAVAGIVLVVAVYLLRERLGNKKALFLAFGVALSPALVAASRQVDGRMLAISGLALAAVFYLRKKSIWMGIATGFAIFGGPSVWNGLLALGLGWEAYHLTAHHPVVGEQPDQEKMDWRPFWFSLAGTVLFLGTLFGFLPGGLSALGDSLSTYVRGWAGEPSTGVIPMLIGWIGLSPLVFIFGIAGLVVAIREHDAEGQWLAWVWVFEILLALAYPGRQAADLAWAALPFLVLGARQAARITWPSTGRLPVWAYAALVAILGVSIAMDVSGFLGVTPPFDATLRWGGVVGAIFLLVASFVLMTWGWSWKMAWKGAIFGGSAVLVVFTLSNSWAAAGLSHYPGMELWVNGVYPQERDLTLKVLGDVSEWNTGRRDWLNLVVSGIDSPALQWELRNYHNVTYVPQLLPDTQPDVVMTLESQGANLGLSSPYTGQRLEWGQIVNWGLLGPADWMRWLAYRDLSNQPGLIAHQSIILWLRSDLFPGATSAQKGQ